MAQNLLAYYCFNDNSATTIKDFSVNEKHLTGTDMSISTDTGAIGKVGIFNGISSKCVFTDFSVLDGLVEFTIVSKIKLTDTPPGPGNRIISHRTDNHDLFVDNNNKVNFGFVTGVGYNFTDSRILNNNQWYIIIVVWDGATLKIYIDSIDSPFSSGATGTMLSTSEDLIIGSDLTDFFDGKIEMISYYNRAFTDSEIVTLLEQPAGIKYISADDKLQTGDLLLNNFGGKEVVVWYEEFDERLFEDGEEHLFEDDEQMMFEN